MSDITLTGNDGAVRDCASGDLWLPYIGNWTCHLILTDADPPPAGRVTVQFHGLELQGHVLRAGQAEDLNTVAIAGGAGGLWQPIAAKMYDNQHSVRLVVQEILAEAGEQLSSTSSSSVLDQILAQYPRLRDEPQHQLDVLSDIAGATWRVLPDGSVFFGIDGWAQPQDYSDADTATETLKYTLLDTDPSFTNLQRIAPVAIAVFPGMSFLLGQVGACRYQDDGQEFIGRIYYMDGTGQPEDPVSAGLRGLVQEELRSTRLHPVFTGRVVLQRNDGRLDIDMDDVRLPPLTNIPYRVPFPGCSMSLPANSRVQVDFEGGDPRRAAARLYEPGSGARAIGLDGDDVDIGYLAVTPGGTGVSAVAWLPPGTTPLPMPPVVVTPMTGKLKGSAPLKFP